MFHWDLGANHSSNRENEPSVKLFWMLNTFFIVEFRNVHALTEGYF